MKLRLSRLSVDQGNGPSSRSRSTATEYSKRRSFRPKGSWVLVRKGDRQLFSTRGRVVEQIRPHSSDTDIPTNQRNMKLSAAPDDTACDSVMEPDELQPAEEAKIDKFHGMVPRRWLARLIGAITYERIRLIPGCTTVECFLPFCAISS